MDIETDILKSYKKFITEKSMFGSILKILPNTPQSFSVFPTIILREVNNSDYYLGKSLEKSEYYDNLSYQVDIYTKDVTIDNVIYPARTVIRELKRLTHDFFRELNFNRNSDTKGDYIDISVSRQILLFSAKINNWNNYLI